MIGITTSGYHVLMPWGKGRPMTPHLPRLPGGGDALKKPQRTRSVAYRANRHLRRMCWPHIEQEWYPAQKEFHALLTEGTRERSLVSDEKSISFDYLKGDGNGKCYDWVPHR